MDTARLIACVSSSVINDALDPSAPCGLRCLARFEAEIFEMMHPIVCVSATVLAGSVALASHATLLPGYSTGTGDNVSQLVIDFAQPGGDSYLFEYRYTADDVTGLDMLNALDSAGSFEVFTTVFSPTFIAVDGFAFGGQSQDIGFDTVTGQFWSYFVSGGFQDTNFDGVFTSDEAVSDAGYTGAGVGATGRLLTDGSVDAWIVNVFAPNDEGNPATNVLPAAVPEPGTLGVLGLGGFVLLRRRR